MALSREVRALKKALLVTVSLTIGLLTYLLVPSSNGYQILVVKSDGSYSHTCDCIKTSGTGGDGASGWIWKPSIAGKYCPLTTNPSFPCPPA